MRATRRVITLAVLGAGLLAGVIALAMSLAGGSGGPAQALGPITVGFDMNTGGNSCPGTGAADCTLGTIDACVEVATGGAVITVDVFLEDLPTAAAGFAGFQYHIGEKTDQTVGTVSAFTHNSTLINLIMQRPTANFQEFSDAVGTSIPSWDAVVGDLGDAEINPPFTHGVLSRLGINTTGRPDGVYGLVIDPSGTGAGLQVLDSDANDYCAPFLFGGAPNPNYTGCNTLDANSATPHGIIAIGVPCPKFADVEIVSQEVREGTCTSAAPTEMDVNTDTVLCLHKTIVNNGPETLVSGTIDADLVLDDGPGNCTITPVSSPTTFTDLSAGPPPVTQTVDEKFTVNCDAPSTHDFIFSNDVVPTTPAGVEDPDPSNNTGSETETDFSIDVLADADVAISSQAFVSPPTEITVGVGTTVTLRKHLLNNGPYGPVDVTVTTDVPAPPPTSHCAAALDSQNPVNPISLPVSIDTVVDEDWMVNCGAEGTGVVLTFENGISPSDPHVIDDTPGNNDSNTDLTVDVVKELGDVNCSGAWDAVDAMFIFQYVMGRRTASLVCPLPPNTLYLAAADVDGDTDVDMVDAFFVFRCVLGYHNVFCPAT